MSSISGFTRGFIKAATHSGLSNAQALTLLKKASRVDALKALFNWGPQVAAGTGGAYMAHEQGASPTMSAAVGLGATQVSSLRRWKELLDIAKASKDPFTSFSHGALKDIGYKAAIPAGVGVMETVPQILSNVKDTTGNSAAITAAAAKEAPTLAKSVGNTMGSMERFWDPSAGSAQKLTDSVQSVADVLKKDVPNLTGSAKELSGSLSKLTNKANSTLDGINQIPSTISNWGNKTVDSIQNLSTNQKVGLGLGGGALASFLLARMLQDKKPKRKIYEY